MRTLAHAQESARGLGHDILDPEHVLVGLLEDELVKEILEALDGDLERARADALRAIGVGEAVVSGPIPLTPRTKKVFELAWDEARALGHGYVSTEHLLIGVAAEAGKGADILSDAGLDAARLRERVGRVDRDSEDARPASADARADADAYYEDFYHGHLLLAVVREYGPERVARVLTELGSRKKRSSQPSAVLKTSRRFARAHSDLQGEA